MRCSLRRQVFVPLLSGLIVYAFLMYGFFKYAKGDCAKDDPARDIFLWTCAGPAGICLLFFLVVALPILATTLDECSSVLSIPGRGYEICQEELGPNSKCIDQNFDFDCECDPGYSTSAVPSYVFNEGVYGSWNNFPVSSQAECLAPETALRLGEWSSRRTSEAVVTPQLRWVVPCTSTGGTDEGCCTTADGQREARRTTSATLGQCVDIDECSRIGNSNSKVPQHLCDATHVCVNQPGSFICIPQGACVQDVFDSDSQCDKAHYAGVCADTDKDGISTCSPR